MNLDPAKLDDVVCPICKGPDFTIVQHLKFVPGLMVGSPTNGTLAIPKYQCVDCRHVLTDEDINTRSWVSSDRESMT